MDGLGLFTVTAFICRYHVTAIGAPVVAHVMNLTPLGVIPIREELAFGIRHTFGLAIVTS